MQLMKNVDRHISIFCSKDKILKIKNFVLIIGKNHIWKEIGERLKKVLMNSELAAWNLLNILAFRWRIEFTYVKKIMKSRFSSTVAIWLKWTFGFVLNESLKEINEDITELTDKKSTAKAVLIFYLHCEKLRNELIGTYTTLRVVWWCRYSDVARRQIKKWEYW